MKVLNCSTAKILIFCGFLMAVLSNPAYSQTLPDSIELIEKFHEINMTFDRKEQEAPLYKLLQEAEIYRDLHPDIAEAWIATGLIRSAYGVTQGISGLGMYKTARRDFEKAISLDSNALNGYSQAFLGRLYVLLPSWPVSYGSKKKALKLLKEALEIDSESMANNSYYAEYLIKIKQYPQAIETLEKAKKEPSPAPNSPFWRASLLQNIEEVLQSIEDRI